MSEYQQQLFRHQESTDMEARNKLRDRLELSHQKINTNVHELSKKKAKNGEDYDKHIKEVFKKYT